MTKTDKPMAEAETEVPDQALPEFARATVVTHGLDVPVIRALLPDDEAEAWDRAPVPGNCPEALEELFRELCVLKYRIHKWESKEGAAETVSSLQKRLDLYRLPLRGLLKAIETHARIIEVEHGVDTGDAEIQYLRTLPAHQLESYLMQGEAPRFHPGTGLPLITPAPPIQDPVTGRGLETDLASRQARSQGDRDLGEARYPGEGETSDLPPELPPWHPDRAENRTGE